MSKLADKLMMGAAGAAGEKVYVEDVFSTYLYTGNSSTQTITNGIDLSGEGGLAWIKLRTTTGSHFLFDTDRGIYKDIRTNSTNEESSNVNYLTAFNSDGFSLGSDNAVNATAGNGGGDYASWTFRKAEKFFDVVTYTGTGSARTVAHNLGSTPGCIIVKRTDSADNWTVYHTSLGNTKYLELNQTAAAGTDISRWNNTTPTSTVFTVGTDAAVNASGGTYVAYLFAHDAGGFGDSGTESVIKCGSYTGNGSTSGPTVTLGWEPQWLLVKRASGGTADWVLLDSMRGVATGGDDEVLYPNLTNAGFSSTYLDFNATGFQLTSTSGTFNASGSDYIYIAIRRGPMKTPTDATKVFSATAYTGNVVNGRVISTAITPDLVINDGRTTGFTILGETADRLRGNRATLRTTSTTAEVTGANFMYFDDMGVKVGAVNSFNENTSSIINWAFRRAPGFFDVVAYTGTGSARTVSHNLGVVPELMIVKRRNTATSWSVYSAAIGASNYLALNLTDASTSFGGAWDSTSPTSSVFTVGTSIGTNASASTYIAYLFATCPGVSKVGSYTGSGTTKDIDCGFTNGARFVLIKRTDSTGDWYVWDTARGVVSGNDPYLLLNSTAAEVTNTDYIDPLSSGFQISSTAPAAINADGGTFIYLAIA